MSNLTHILIALVILVISAFVLQSCQNGKKSLSEKELYPKNVIPNEIVHETLTDEQLKKIKKIHETFIEIYPISLEQTIINFKRDVDPNPEIEIWLQMADVYNSFASKHHKKEEFEFRKEAFQLILLRSMMNEEETLKNVALKSLSESQAKEVLSNCKFTPTPIKFK